MGKTFWFEGREYEIRVLYGIAGFTARVSLNGKRVNPYCYSVSDDDDDGLQEAHGISAYEYLAQLAESDVRDKCWEKYLLACGISAA